MEDSTISGYLALTWSLHHVEYDDDDQISRGGEIEVFKVNYDPKSNDFTLLLMNYPNFEKIKLLSSSDGVKILFKKWIKKCPKHNGKLKLLDGHKEIFIQQFSNYAPFKTCDYKVDTENYKIFRHKINTKIIKAFNKCLLILYSVKVHCN